MGSWLVATRPPVETSQRRAIRLCRFLTLAEDRLPANEMRFGDVLGQQLDIAGGQRRQIGARLNDWAIHPERSAPLPPEP